MLEDPYRNKRSNSGLHEATARHDSFMFKCVFNGLYGFHYCNQSCFSCKDIQSEMFNNIRRYEHIIQLQTYKDKWPMSKLDY